MSSDFNNMLGLFILYKICTKVCKILANNEKVNFVIKNLQVINKYEEKKKN